MMRLHIQALLLLLFLAPGCIKEVTTMDRLTITNAGSHQIMIRYYYYDPSWGVQNYTVELAAGERKTDTSITGQAGNIEDTPGFTFYDSVRVIFDHRDSIMHYRQDTEHFSGKFYLFSSLRNLLNMNSYEVKATKDKRQFQDLSYTYIFTDEDYEDARR